MSSAGAAPVRRQPVTHLCYLHGFRSSPQSTKARKFAAWVAAHRPGLVWWCPQLPASPAEAMRSVLAHVAAWPSERMAVVGSSLGGFYATAVAEQRGCRAVLLNSAIDPARDLVEAIGDSTAWHSGDPFVFRAEYIDELRRVAPPPTLTDPDRYLAVIAKGDEVLSWREMSARYAGCPMRLIEGSDHALSDFDAHFPALLAFLGLDAGP
ncbi:MAG: esterase [Pseudomonadota bacterium]|nr:esterase [Pseudomonadota bacterium]